MFDFMPLGGYSFGSSPNLIATSSFATGAATVPTQKQAGDIIVAHVVVGVSTGDATVTAPSGEGWNTVTSISETGGATNNVSYVFWKRWGQGGQTDNTSVTFTQSAGDIGVVLIVVRGAKATGDVVGTEFSTNHGTGGTSLTVSAAVPASNLRLGLNLFGTSVTGNISGISGLNWNTSYNGASFATTAGVNRAMGAAYNRTIPLIGSTCSATSSATMNSWTVIQILIRAV